MRIVLKHLSGSKAHQVEHFPTELHQELTLGRDPGCVVTFDSAVDDVVSRRHATIRAASDGSQTFRVADLGSSNGTFLNGEQLAEEREIFPEDELQLGTGGPKLIFDLEPRPATLMRRTRAQAYGAAGNATASFGGRATGTGKSYVGKETIERLIHRERQVTSRMWLYGVAGLLFVTAALGAVLLYYGQASEQRIAGRVVEARARADATAAELTDKVGEMTPKQIAAAYAAATVYIESTWRLYDVRSGKQVFHKYKTIREGVRLPSYVEMPDGSIVRWLITDDENQTNHPIGQASTGSAFVVTSTGFALTNKHVAAGWLTEYRVDPAEAVNGAGLLYQYNNQGNVREITIQELNARASFLRWRPGVDVGYLFSKATPKLVGDGPTSFEGRSFKLAARFPGNNLSVEARFIRASSKADAAVIKVDVPQAVTSVTLASEEYRPVLGERVAVMGYPGISEKTIFSSVSTEAGQAREVLELIPEPTLTEGIVANIGAGLTQAEDDPFGRLHSTAGDVFQLTINATGSGNSGGPVFNSSGEVIGLFTYMTGDGLTAVSYAVPIRYGIEILNLRRVAN